MPQTIAALGSFDGLHMGHWAVLQDAQLPATVCLLFDGLDKSAQLLTTEKRDALLREAGIEPVVFAFDELQHLTPAQYVDEVLCAQLHVDGVVCGYNYHFGAGAAGDADTLRTLCAARGIACRVVPPVLQAGMPVSATRIREALRLGDVPTANALLGRPFGYDFPVAHGDARGRTLGYPTANQFFPEGFLIPRRGVYASRVTLAGTVYPAMTNIGLRPTYASPVPLSETHLFGFSGDLYGQKLPVELLAFIRDERAFASAEELTKQLTSDAKQCKARF
ncbi:MAG: riboflavin biosynthesis protein RibF [Oscillospiraceae bacterium]|jgi:riboflavin kinase/FMN adenylyltransferase|nr:riboflavin biosynthesis protein RibF [Oscillospiraceae bacterium]